MKKFINIVLLGLLGTSLVSAQSSADALKFSENFVNGSARYVGMGGAFGALGGDFSSLGSNPAGLGVYRSSEFTISTSFNKGNFTSEYAGSTRNSKQNLLLDNLGVVFSFKPERSDGTGIVGVNFGIGYNRGGNYNLDSRLNTGLQDYSIMDYWANKANGIDWLTGADLEETSDYDPYNDPAIPLDILTAWKTGLLKYDAANNYFHAPLSGSTLYEFAPYQMIQNEGGKSEYDFSLGLNFEHKFYFGMTLGLQSIDLSRYSLYSELLYNTKDINEPNKFDYLEYAENIAITGSGVNFKLGAIYRPVEWLRVGLAFHTPTYFSLEENYSYFARSEFVDGANVRYDPDTETTPRFRSKYDLQTPLKVIASAAIVFGDFGLISFDYDYSDYTSMTFKDGVNGDPLNNLNNEVKDVYRATNSFRVGGEFRVDNFFFRAGGAYYSSPYKSAFLNKDADNLIISGGLGYRYKSVYVDLAYSRLMHEEKYVFFDMREADGSLSLAPVTQKWSLGRTVLTFGIKF